MKFKLFKSDGLSSQGIVNVLAERLKASRIGYGGNVLPWKISPGYLHMTEKQSEQLTLGIEYYAQFLNAVFTAIQEGDVLGREVLEVLGGAGLRRELFDSATLEGFGSLPMLRPDAFWDIDGQLTFAEVEEMIGGYGFCSALFRARNNSDQKNPLLEAYGIMVDKALAAHKSDLVKKTKNPVVLIVNPREKDGYNDEFLVLSEALQSYGLDVILAEPSEISISGDAVFCRGKQIDLIHRFFRLTELQRSYADNGLEELCEISKKNLIPVVQPWREILSEKALYAFLHKQDKKRYWLDTLGQEVYTTLKSILPFTMMCDPKYLAHDSSAVFSKQDKFFAGEIKKQFDVNPSSGYHQKDLAWWLKLSSDGWGGKTAYFTKSYSGAEWRRKLLAAFSGFSSHQVWVLQNHRQPEQVSIGFAEGEKVTYEDMFLRVCPYAIQTNGSYDVPFTMVTARDDIKVHCATDAADLEASTKELSIVL